jgi:hypothetical protein
MGYCPIPGAASSAFGLSNAWATHDILAINRLDKLEFWSIPTSTLMQEIEIESNSVDWDKNEARLGCSAEDGTICTQEAAVQ